MLTGLELFLSDLLSFLYTALTEAILVFSEKHEHSKSVFIILVRCQSITLAGNFIILRGFPSAPVVFLGFRCLVSISISSFFCFRKTIFLGIRGFFSNLINTWMVFIIANHSINRSDVICRLSTSRFNNVYLMRVQSSCNFNFIIYKSPFFLM